MSLLSAIFLQVDTTAVTAASSGMSLWRLFLSGGIFMLPIFGLLVLAVYIIIERYLTIKKANKSPDHFLEQIRKYVKNGEIDKAQAFCHATNTPFSRMISKGISRLGSSLEDITASIENVGKLEVYRLEKSLFLLAMVAGAAPMLGFLGTVTGMIQAFMTISTLTESVKPSDLASGIYEAMVTTAAGLIVGIPAYLGYNLLVGMISNVIYRMEVTTTHFIDLLQEPVK
jgi:biopolymer transport protein ExbB